MNIDRLHALIDIYIDQFDSLNNEYHNENMKWAAIHHFKNTFNMDAPDFYEMFKEAISKSAIIINNGTVQPANGILRLIKHDEAAVKRLFTMLYSDDGGDLDKRQERIEHFVEEANQLLEKYERGKWKFKQDFRSVLAYLVFKKPEDNYLYKSSQCQPFFRYLDYGEEIGYGRYFKLSRYYRMCDEVRQLLSTHQALLNKHQNRYTKVGDPKDDLHILTFDLIYCSIVYDFYEYRYYTKIIKKSKADLSRQNFEAEIEQKNSELESLIAELEKEQHLLDEIPEIRMENLTVKHKLFGVGTVIQQNGSLIDVKFANKTTQFLITKSFADGFLNTSDATVFERSKRIELSINRCRKLEQAIKSKQEEIYLLTTKIMK